MARTPDDQSTKDGSSALDNSSAERFPWVRENWLLAKIQASAQDTASIYSLTESAIANGLNPYEYLRHVFKALPNIDGEEV